MKANETQIKKWKQEFFEVYEVEIIMEPGTMEPGVEPTESDIAYAYVKKPTIKMLNLSARIEAEDKGDTTRSHDFMINECVLQMDPRVSKSDEAKLALVGHIAELFKIKESSIKKL